MTKMNAWKERKVETITRKYINYTERARVQAGALDLDWDELTWRQKNGKIVKVNKMTDRHLSNTIFMLHKKISDNELKLKANFLRLIDEFNKRWMSLEPDAEVELSEECNFPIYWEEE